MCLSQGAGVRYKALVLLLCLLLSTEDAAWARKRQPKSISQNATTSALDLSASQFRYGALQSGGKLTGQPGWSVSLKNGPLTASPTSDGKSVFVSNQAVYAIDPVQGQVQWRKELQTAVTFLNFAEHMLLVTTEDGRLVALHQNGDIRWEFQASSPLSQPVAGAGYGVVISTSADGIVYAVDLATGKLRWQQQVGHDRLSPVCVYQGKVFMADTAHNVWALEMQQGFPLWQTQVDGPVVAAPIAVGNQLFLTSTVGTVYALELNNGSKRWSHTLVSGSPIYGSPAWSDALIIFADSEGWVTAVDANSGVRRWQTQLGLAADTAPAVVDGVVYVNTANGQVVALDAHTGHQKWHHDLNTLTRGSVLVQKHGLFVGGQDGRVYSLK
jgi:outer membrane protein assembly factor BamB